MFFHALYQLADQGLQFKVSVLGERFSEVPGDFFQKIFYINLIKCTFKCQFCGRYGGLMVSALDSGASGPGSILHNKTSNKRFIIQHTKLVCSCE